MDSVGLIPKRLPFTTSNTIVRTFRHALALDERRAKFKANLWNRPTKQEEKLGVQASSITPLAESPPVTPVSEKSPSTPTFLPKSLLPSFKNANGNEQVSEQAGVNPKERKRSNRSENDKKLDQMERMYSSKGQSHTTDIEEVWFAVRFTSYTTLAILLMSYSGMSR